MEYLAFMDAIKIYRKAVSQQLEKRITGKIYIDYFPLKDCFYIQIINKGFVYDCKIYGISEKMNKGTSSIALAIEIIKSYKSEIFKYYFKNS